MAGQEIYLGKMIEALQTDIATMVSTLNAHTTALGNINTAVSQGISSIICEYSDTENPIIISDVDLVGNGSTGAVVKTIKCFTEGGVRFSGRIKNSVSSPTAHAILAISINGGAYVNIAQSAPNSTAYTSFTHNLVTARGDKIDFKLFNQNGGGYAATVEAGFKANYKKLDIANDGAIVV